MSAFVVEDKTINSVVSFLSDDKYIRRGLYQCAEGDVPDTSLLYATMDRISANLAHRIVGELPEYDTAEWG